MIAKENKNLILTYVITLAIAALLIVVIFNFNNWFFPNDQMSLSSFKPSSRGLINERDLRFNVLDDKKFTSLEPILSKEQLSVSEPQGENNNTVTGTEQPSVRQPIELRHGNPFEPF